MSSFDRTAHIRGLTHPEHWTVPIVEFEHHDTQDTNVPARKTPVAP